MWRFSPSALFICGRNQNCEVSMTNFIEGWLPLKRAWKPTQPYKYVSVVIKFKCSSCQLKKTTATHCEDEMALSWTLRWSVSSQFLVRETGCAGPAVVHRWLAVQEYWSKTQRVKQDCSVLLCWEAPVDDLALSVRACLGCACYQMDSFWTHHWRSQTCE